MTTSSYISGAELAVDRAWTCGVGLLEKPAQVEKTGVCGEPHSEKRWFRKPLSNNPGIRAHQRWERDRQ